jgi:glycosyltransferase involved in cell wall biosynthesis
MLDSGATTCVVIPVLRRPHRVAPLLESLIASRQSCWPLFVATEGDVDEIAALVEARVAFLLVPPKERGDYAAKIQAGYEATTAPFIFTAADDLHFHPGWLSAALRHMIDPAIGVVGTNDLGNTRVLEGRHSTHSLVRRSYVEEFGTIDEPGQVLHGGYWHEYVDDELVQTAKIREAWAFAADSVVEHLHPNWGKGEGDDLYAEQYTRMAIDKPLFKRRRHLWLHPSPS